MTDQPAGLVSCQTTQLPHTRSAECENPTEFARVPTMAERTHTYRPELPAAQGNVTRLLVTVEWHGDYYQPGERVDMLREWIEGALTDRDDSPGVTIIEMPERQG